MQSFDEYWMPTSILYCMNFIFYLWHYYQKHIVSDILKMKPTNYIRHFTRAAIYDKQYIVYSSFILRHWIFPHLSFTIESKDLKADAWSASSLDLMQMSEEVEPRSSPSIVQFTLCQNTQESGLARINITQDSYTQVQELPEKTQRINRIYITKYGSTNKRTTKQQHGLTIALQTCWSSGTFRMRTSAILRCTSES